MVSPDVLSAVLRRIEKYSSPTSVAARLLAAAGVPVFPCVPGAKRPLTAHGFHDASTAPGHVAGWWQRYPQANIGVPTGAPSGMVVVDVDVHGPMSGYAAFDRAMRAGLVDGWECLVETPSGGMHAYYPTADGVQRSWQAARAGVDFRGDGGYVVVPPSMVTVEGVAAGYRLRKVNTAPARTMDSERLRGFLDPRPASLPRSHADGPRATQVSRLAGWVATRSEGERNRGLFWAACRLAENNVPSADALDVLTAAAKITGLGEREITSTIRSAYRATGPKPSSTRGREAARSFDSAPAARLGSVPARGLS